MSDALLSTLAEALAELVTAVETSEDEDLDPDTAVKWLENTGHTLGRLGAADRRTLDGLFREAALRGPAGPRRDELLKVSEGLGLTEDAYAAGRDAAPESARRLGTPESVRPASPTASATTPPTASPDAACDVVAEHVLRFAALVREADPATPVPTCPGWTLADLTRHLGAVHRWAEHLVRTRAAVRVRVRDLPLDLPTDPAAYADWLTAGAESALTALRTTAPDLPVWSPGADPHARYYPRLLLAEAVVHLADAELALGGAAGAIDPRTAAAAIDHFLTDAPYVPWIAEPLAHLGRDGAVLRLTARDTGAVWTLTLGGGGFTRSRGAGGAEPTAGVTADTGELLLLLHRRYAADDPRFTHTGDRELLDDWLAATAL
ncbi:maleylpyruvate isomerase N-terminal domain-containing protein [Streptomyces vietnamensis]|uniref:maleylpyruvate isomerase N-terminal domain-containing protein n=1 Tax=Streptomyces vietnamensis TaxID=362257 RepID=UPI00059A8124|nr:maleylpyruvate isomerase N-terminal domain-containing protein [Streptomyces vietnamensis]